jgi:spore coat protein U-like protein
MSVIGITHMVARFRGLPASAVLVLLMLALPGPARAACTGPPGAVSLGSVTSFVAASTSQNATGPTGFSCTGSVLALFGTNTITATIASATNSSGTQPRLGDPATGDFIPFVVCKDAGCSPTYGIGGQITWSSTTFGGLLGFFNATGTLPISIRTLPGAQMAAGTYKSTITVNWTWRLCTAGLGPVCIYDQGSLTSTIDVTMIVSRDCAISAPPLDFGKAAFASSFDPVTQSISIRCSKGATYTVGMDDGTHFSSNRRLANGANSIGYEIYYPATSAIRWGKAGAERVGSSQATANAGLYTGSTNQLYTYKAQILSGQPTPPPGVYTDTLTVDVQF